MVAHYDLKLRVIIMCIHSASQKTRFYNWIRGIKYTVAYGKERKLSTFLPTPYTQQFWKGQKTRMIFLISKQILHSAILERAEKRMIFLICKLILLARQG